MTSCLGKRGSSSVYLLAPKDSPGLSSCSAEWCSQSACGNRGEDLDHSRPTEWLNDLVKDQVADRASRSKSDEKPLHAGDIAAVERTLQVSSCALILGLLYAERLQVAEEACPQPSVVGEERPDQPAAPASDEFDEFDDSPPESSKTKKTGDNDSDNDATVDDPDNEGRYSISAADLFLVCVLTANKYLYDEGEPDSLLNGDMAHAGRRKAKKMNELERIFLRKMDWNLYVRQDEFESFLKRLERTLTVRALHSSNGHLLYQDACQLWDIITSQSLLALGVLGRVCALVAAMYGVLGVALPLFILALAPVPAEISPLPRHVQTTNQCSMPIPAAPAAQVPVKIFSGPPLTISQEQVKPIETVYRHPLPAPGLAKRGPRHALVTRTHSAKGLPSVNYSTTLHGRQDALRRTTGHYNSSLVDLDNPWLGLARPDDCYGTYVFQHLDHTRL